MNQVFSFWEKNLYETPYDFTIIGGGFTGLSAAIHLKKQHPNKRVLLLERGVVPYGASTKNAGFSCFGSIGELMDDRSHMSEQEVLDTVKLRFYGLQLLRKLIPDDVMDYKTCGGIELFKSAHDFEEAYAQMGTWNRLLDEVVGPEVFEAVDQELPEFYSKAINNRYEGSLDPAKAVAHLWAQAQKLGVEILPSISLESYEENKNVVILKTNLEVQLSTKQLVICTNAFTNNLMPELDIQPARNQVLITKPLDVNPLKSCYHFDKGYVYFRSVGNRILLGGARNISEHELTASYGNTEEIQQHLTNFLHQYISSGAEIDHWWSGIIATGSAKKPLIGKNSDKISFGLRLSGMGVAIGTFVGKQVAELHM